jgi:hypothetical protein
MNVTMKIHKYISTGGLGDAFIVSLKIRQLAKTLNPAEEMIEWVHVESNQIVADLVDELFAPRERTDISFGLNSNVMVDGVCDPNYIQNYKDGKWREYTPISSGVDSHCPLKGNTKIELTDAFRAPIRPTRHYEYDICFQVSGGAKNNRKWKFDVISAARLLKNEGFSVALVGNEPDFYEKYPDVYNFVGRMTLEQSLKVIDNSRLFVGLSGFLNYYACARQIKNVHLIESEQHEERYYHPDWNEFTKGVKNGSLQELMPIFKKLERLK